MPARRGGRHCTRWKHTQFSELHHMAACGHRWRGHDRTKGAGQAKGAGQQGRHSPAYGQAAGIWRRRRRHIGWRLAAAHLRIDGSFRRHLLGTGARPCICSAPLVQ